MGKYYFFLSGFVIALLFAIFFSANTTGVYDPVKKVESFQQVFLEREVSARQYMDKRIEQAHGGLDSLFSCSDVVKSLNERYYTHGEIYFLIKDEQVDFLSHNALPLHVVMVEELSEGLFNFGNGWYYLASTEIAESYFWVASLVKKDFRYKNRFLVNEFYPEYKLTENWFVSLDLFTGYPIHNTQNEHVFSVGVDDSPGLIYQNQTLYVLSIAFYILAILFWFGFLVSVYRGLLNRKSVFRGSLFLVFFIFLSRYLLFTFQLPAIFYESELFSAVHYAASVWLPSLGDLLFNVFCLFVLLFIFYLHKGFYKGYLTSAKYFYLIIFFAIFTLVAYSGFIVYLLNSLIINSNLTMDVNFIIEPDIYNVIGLLIIAQLFATYYFYSRLLLVIIQPSLHSSFKHLLFVFGIAVLFIFIGYLLYTDFFYLWILLFGVGLFMFLFRQHIFQTVRFTPLIFTFFFFAVIGTYGLNIFNYEKESSKRINMAIRLASEQDPVAEYLFAEMEGELFNDQRLLAKVLMDPYAEEEHLQYLRTHYFYDFWTKYDIQLTACGPADLLYLKNIDSEFYCQEYFEFMISETGRTTLSDNFLYLDNNTGRNSYLTVIPIADTLTNRYYNLYVEFEARFIPKELGFPELLVDEQVDISRNLGNYSYAIYKEEILTLKYGSFFYSISADVYTYDKAETFSFFKAGDYDHLIYQRDTDTLVIVSKPRESILERIAVFSYLFIIYFLLSLIIWLAETLLNRSVKFSLNFKKRLQFSVILIVLLSVVSIGGASTWFIVNIYKNKNEAIINEKAHSILIELENLLSEEPYLDDEYSEYINQVLMRLSQVFFTDINLYNPEGILLSSSRPRVFDERLISVFMHPVAFNELKISAKTLFIHHERIGNLEYISTYIPLSNVSGELIAYINLPYFAQQSELRNEISYFLVAFINIYLLLLLLSVIMAFFISNYVTLPLQTIRDGISRVSFGKINQKINWKRDDEIGQLIKEYNRMIDELAASAELLARSERESAWREMAKQVAHEIKNPLTPMRLNVQYLQRAWKDRTPDWDERLDRFTKTMVEQIDSLAVIAAEFSDFAKMPAGKYEKIDLRELIPEVVDLFNGFENLTIELQLPENTKGALLIAGDKKQFARVFNNLIKNSIQAYEKGERAHVIIYCQREENYYRLEVQDFAKGIAPELQKNIFQPYFTTKSGGMGLGLAMVKSIVESFNGHISFNSQQGEGTSFVMRIPALERS